MARYASDPRVVDNGDGTWTVGPDHENQHWTVVLQPTGQHVADPIGYRGASHHYTGSFDEVCFNIIGWL